MTNKGINSESLERIASITCAGLLAIESEAWLIVGEGKARGISDLVNSGMSWAAFGGYLLTTSMIIGSVCYFGRELRKEHKSPNYQS